ncbi:MAG: hypothetical protein QF579_02220, partial [Dehalococcoidia bacterium]|nr:hypothetical protein [Dehalococcoidia bacterium]
ETREGDWNCAAAALRRSRELRGMRIHRLDLPKSRSRRIRGNDRRRVPLTDTVRESERTTALPVI